MNLESDRFARALQMLLISMILLVGIDLYLRSNSEASAAVSTPVADLSPLTAENQQLRQELEQAMAILSTCFNTQVTLDRVRTAAITLTAYTSTVEECDDTPHYTASSKAVRHGIIAVSTDLVKELGLKFGQRVLIPGHGIFEVEDRMNPRMRRTVDIWMGDRKAALLFGKQQGTLFWIAPEEPTVAVSAS